MREAHVYVSGCRGQRHEWVVVCGIAVRFAGTVSLAG